MTAKLLFALLLWGSAAGADLLACGDKFLVPSRGTRFARAPVAREKVSILVYARPGSALADELGETSIAAILIKAGYRATVAVDAEQLQSALGKGSWNLVLADLADSEGVRGRSRDSRSPAILPVLREPKREVLARARKEYGTVLETPSKSARILETVDRVITLRAK